MQLRMESTGLARKARSLSSCAPMQKVGCASNTELRGHLAV